MRTLKSNLSLSPDARQTNNNHCQKYEIVFLSDSTDQSSSATSCNRDDKAVLLITHTAKQSLHQLPVCKVELVCLHSGLEDSFYWKTPLMFWKKLNTNCRLVCISLGPFFLTYIRISILSLKVMKEKLYMWKKIVVIQGGILCFRTMVGLMVEITSTEEEYFKSCATAHINKSLLNQIWMPLI